MAGAAALAQLVEHVIRNDGVRCSSHLSGTISHSLEFYLTPPLFVLDKRNGNRYIGGTLLITVMDETRQKSVRLHVEANGRKRMLAFASRGFCQGRLAQAPETPQKGPHDAGPEPSPARAVCIQWPGCTKTAVRCYAKCF
jgi:hypothetical protein